MKKYKLGELLPGIGDYLPVDENEEIIEELLYSQEDSANDKRIMEEDWGDVL